MRTGVVSSHVCDAFDVVAAAGAEATAAAVAAAAAEADSHWQQQTYRPPQSILRYYQ